MALPGLPAHAPNGLINPSLDYDFGPDFNYLDGSGVQTLVPPRIKHVINLKVPRVDKDGNELAGVPSVLHQVPLGTYTGWNATAAGFFKGQPCGGGLTGGYIPFTKSKAEHESAGDPRPSLEERYGTQAGYICAVKRVAKQEVARRFLRSEDADRLIATAIAADNFLNVPPSPQRESVAEALCRL